MCKTHRTLIDSCYYVFHNTQIPNHKYAPANSQTLIANSHKFNAQHIQTYCHIFTLSSDSYSHASHFHKLYRQLNQCFLNSHNIDKCYIKLTNAIYIFAHAQHTHITYIYHSFTNMNHNNTFRTDYTICIRTLTHTHTLTHVYHASLTYYPHERE